MNQSESNKEIAKIKEEIAEREENETYKTNNLQPYEINHGRVSPKCRPEKLFFKSKKKNYDLYWEEKCLDCGHNIKGIIEGVPYEAQLELKNK